MAILLFVMLAKEEHALAVDPPHNGKNSLDMTMSCSTCHYDTTGPAPSWATQPTTTDDTFFNNLCMSCHLPSKMTDSRYIVKTHSYQNTSGKYGVWTVECRTCHNPHYQDQVNAYPTDATADLVTGALGTYSQPPITATQTVIPVVGSIAGDWTDHTLVPNTIYPTKMYRIKSNTADSITVFGPVNARYAAPGSRFAIRYGKMVKAEVGLPTGGVKAVKFFGSSGLNSFGTSTDPANMTSLCQVCHVQTTSFNNSGVLEGPGHPALQSGRDCTVCHQHMAGFKPKCGSCHGNPPLINVLGGPDGLALNDGGTGPTTPGAHGKHAVSFGYSCTTCHSGGMPASTIYDKLIQIGFNIARGAYLGGSYDGRSSLANGYSYTAGNAGTTITNTGSKACTNIYCHGSTIAPNGGTDITPVWDNPATAVCGTCHGATSLNPPVRGSHEMHASETAIYPPTFPPYVKFPRKYACTVCHADLTSKHVNGNADWAFDGANDRRVSGAAYKGLVAGASATVPSTYGQCSNLYCHSISQTSTGGPLTGKSGEYRTPTWGNSDSGKCGTCHPVDVAHAVTVSGFPDTTPEMSSGSHARHLAYSFTLSAGDFYKCALCHKYDAAGAFGYCHPCHNQQNTKHVNGKVDVQFEQLFASGTVTYTGTPEPGDGFGSCSNTYCHSNGTSISSGAVPANTSPLWGSGALACNSCHGVGGDGSGRPEYATSAPKANSHQLQKHASLSCDKCHYPTTTTGTSIASTTTHVNKVYDVVGTGAQPYTFTYAYATGGGTCSNGYCHSDGTSLATGIISTNTAPPWGGGYAIACNNWDGIKSCTAYECHGIIRPGQPSCGFCHFGTTITKTYSAPTPHGCKKCHEYPPSYPQMTSTTASPKANEHAYHSTGVTKFPEPGCQGCHYTTTTTGDTITNPANHVNGQYDVVVMPGLWWANFTYRPDPGGPGGYCDNVTCHGGVPNTAFWGRISPYVSGSASSFGPGCYDTTLTINDSNMINFAFPVAYTWNFGDGQTESGTSNGAPISAFHHYADGAKRTVTFSGRDGLKRNFSGLSYVNPQAVGNISPTGAFTVAEVNRYTVTIKDLSYDPDYNSCGQGPGTISITWKTGTTNQYSINLTDVASNASYSSPCVSNYPYPTCTNTYTAAGNYRIFHQVVDHAGGSSYQTYRDITLPGPTSISGKVFKPDGTTGLAGVTVDLKRDGYSSVNIATTTTGADGSYSFSGAYDDPSFWITLEPKGGYAFSAGQTVYLNRTDVNFTSMLGAPSTPVVVHEPGASCFQPACAVVLQWGPSENRGDPVEYYAEIDTDQYLSSPDHNSGWISGTSWSIDLPTDSTYFWHVRARDIADPSAVSIWSGGYYPWPWSWLPADTFTLYAAYPPPAPVLTHEQDYAIGGTITSANVTLDWSAVASPDGDAVQYYAELGAAPDFSGINYGSGWISGTSWSLNLGAGTWYWRVSARDAVHLAVSPWAGDSFAIFVVPPPPVPTLIAEPNTSTDSSTNVTLQWNPVASPDGHTAGYSAEIGYYRVICLLGCSNVYFASSNSDWISGTSWTVRLPADTWYWKVKARDSVHTGSVSTYSSQSTFTISPITPAAPVPVAEPDYAVGGGTADVTLEWSSVAFSDGDAAQYCVEIDSASDLSSPDYNSGWISGANWTTTLPLGTWYWRVKARDSVHTGAATNWSTTDAFLIGN